MKLPHPVPHLAVHGSRLLAMLLATTLSPAPAQAGDAALAEALFREAKTLMDGGDYASACPKLEESFAQDPATGTLLALALCQERSGQTASAWATYGSVVGRSLAEGQKERERFARERQQALEPSLSKLSIIVPDEVAALPGLEVTRDGNSVGAGAWGIPAPVDPGEHLLEVSATGKQTWTLTLTVGSNADVQQVTIPQLEDEHDTPATAVATPGPSLSEPVPPAASAAQPSTATGNTSSLNSPSPNPNLEQEPRAFPLETLGLVVGGVGVIGLTLSGYFGLRALSLNDDSQQADRCDSDNFCDNTGLKLRNDAVDASNLATVFLISGSVLTATGATLYLVGSTEEPASPQVELGPSFTTNVAGLLMQGQF